MLAEYHPGSAENNLDSFVLVRVNERETQNGQRERGMSTGIIIAISFEIYQLTVDRMEVPGSFYYQLSENFAVIQLR